MKKYLLGLCFVLVLGGASRVNAVTLAELQALLQTLQAQLNALQATQSGTTGGTTTGGTTTTSSGSFCYNFDRNIQFGDGISNVGSSADVSALQVALEKEGFIVDSSEKKGGGIFQESTAAAVVGFQEKYAKEILAPVGLAHGTGFVGASTRAKLNALYGCSNTTTVTPPNPTTINPSAPIVNLTANYASGNTSVTVGSSVVLRWTYSNASTCSTNWGYTGSKDSDTVYPAKGVNVYIVTCRNTAGQANSSSVYVYTNTITTPTPTANPTTSLNVGGYSSTGYQSPIITVPAGTVNFSWSAENASYCSAYGQTRLHLSDGTYWNSYNLPTSSSASFSTSGQVDGNGKTMYNAVIGIQCWGTSSASSAFDSKGIIVTWTPTVTGPSSPTIGIDGSSASIPSGTPINLAIGKYPSTASSWTLSDTCPSGVSINQKAGGCAPGGVDSTGFTNSGYISWPVTITNSSSVNQTVTFSLTAYDSSGVVVGSSYLNVTIYPAPATSVDSSTTYDYDGGLCSQYTSAYSAPGSVFVGNGPVYTNSQAACGVGMTPDINSYRVSMCSPYEKPTNGAHVTYAFKCVPHTTAAIPSTNYANALSSLDSVLKQLSQMLGN